MLRGKAARCSGRRRERERARREEFISALQARGEGESMSSDDEKEEGGKRGGRMAFTDETDFEGGRWINGEFYFEKQKKGQTQSAEERLYGVFGDISSDEEEGGRRSKKSKRKQGSTRTDLSKPMEFVGGEGGRRAGGAGRSAKEMQLKERLRKEKKPFRGGIDDETDVEIDMDDDDDDEDDDGDDEDGGTGMVRAAERVEKDGHESDASSEAGDAGFLRSQQTRRQVRELLKAAGAVAEATGTAASVSKSTAKTAGTARTAGTSRAAGTTGTAGTAGTTAQGEMKSNADFRAMIDKPSATSAPAASASASAAGASASAAGASASASATVTASAKATATATATAEGKQGTDKKAQEDAKSKKPARPAKFDSGFGGWEKHTKGVGMKLMLKMGFTGRLGKHEDGVMRQLEVKVRPDQTGLGFGNFKEATTLKVNREIEADRQGKTLEQLEAEKGLEAAGAGRGKGPKSKAEQMADKGLWRKGAAGKKRKRFITPEELLERQEEEKKGDGKSGGTGQIIIDMRGPQAKLVSSMDDLAPLATGLAEGEKPKLGQELLHNVGLIIGVTETEIQTLHWRRLGEQDRATALRRDEEELRKKVESSAERLSRIEQVETILTRVHDKVVSDPGGVTADHVLKAFNTVRERFPEEYAVFGLAQLVPAMAAPMIKRSLEGWSPLQLHSEPARILSSWKGVLTDTSGVADEEGRARRWEGQAAYQYVASELVLPGVRSSLINDWEVRDPTPALAVVEGLALADVGDDIVQALLDQAVLPKLTRGVTEWNPRTDRIAIHTWIHPWLPYLGSRLAGVFPEIRRKLGAVLVEWHPSDASAHAMLEPWKTVFDARSMEALLIKYIVPKIVEVLRTSLVINPANQDMTVFNMLMMWADVIPALHFTSILEGEFFPKWLTVLHQWLSHTADYAEVPRWYKGWKDCFPEHLQSDPRVMAQFNTALTLMEQVMADHQKQGVPLPPGASEEMSYRLVVERRSMEAAALRRQQLEQQQQQKQHVSGAAGGGGGASTASFREVVEAFAGANGVTFLPKPGRQYEGKPIYSFGGVSIFLDQSVVFTETPRGSGKWGPLGLEELLALTGHGRQQQTPSGATDRERRSKEAPSHAFGGLD